MDVTTLTAGCVTAIEGIAAGALLILGAGLAYRGGLKVYGLVCKALGKA